MKVSNVELPDKTSTTKNLSATLPVMKRALYGWSLSIIMVWTVPTSIAAEIAIEPILALSSDQSHILSTYKEYSEGRVRGAGSRLRISYGSSTPLNGYIAILNGTTYNPANLYHFNLPADYNGIVALDLTALTTWNPGSHEYYLNFLSTAEKTDAKFHEMQFFPSRLSDVAGAIAKHLVQAEPYWISSAHLLRGYRILAIPFSMLLGLLTLVLAGAHLLRKGRSADGAVLCILLVAVFLYELRFGIDLLSYTQRHLHEWWSSHTYAEARDLYSASEALKTEIARSPDHPASVSVCFDSTDYYAKLLRYLLYPIPVSITGKYKEGLTHVLVTRKTEWGYDGETLRCGEISHGATMLQAFDDGSVLFSLNAP